MEPARSKFQKLYWYPHLGEHEQIIWDRFVRLFPDIYDECEYDVKVGPGQEFDTVVNQETGGDAVALYQKKIDVVGYKGNQIDIIEVKPYAGVSAVSQLIQYRFLYMRDRKPQVVPKLIVVTDRMKQGLVDFAASMGVLIVVV